MLIGIDALPLVPPKTGIGHYTFELAQSLAALAPSDEFQLISPVPLPKLFDHAINPDSPTNLRATHIKKPLSRRWWTIGLPLYTMRSALALFHGTNYNVPLWSPGCCTVNSIHDLSLLLYPDTHEAEVVRRARRRLPLMARAATMIITATESAKRDVCEHLGIAPCKVSVTPFAPRSIFRRVPIKQSTDARRRLDVEEQFVLFVGTVEPRKNLITLVRAFDELLRTTDLRPQLVIAGKEGWLTGELFAHIKKAGIGERIRFTGYVSDEDLCALYSACQVLIYPSLYEGFGLPPLEAMACGAPVIASRASSIVETLGAAARLVPATDVQALTQNLVHLLANENQRRHLAALGQQRAAEFSWERTARATMDVYREALGRRGRKAAG